MSINYTVFTDPRGLPVEFSDNRWKYITQKHPDLLEYNVTEEDIQSAIEDPCDGCIYSSKKYPDCMIYYKRFSKKLQIRFVVKFNNNIGELLTAHFLIDRSSGEKIVWRKGSK